MIPQKIRLNRIHKQIYRTIGDIENISPRLVMRYEVYEPNEYGELKVMFRFTHRFTIDSHDISSYIAEIGMVLKFQRGEDIKDLISILIKDLISDVEKDWMQAYEVKKLMMFGNINEGDILVCQQEIIAYAQSQSLL